MVIKTSEQKYTDIHNKYRSMANELHESWKMKYEILEKENEKLVNCLQFLINKNKPSNDNDDNEEPLHNTNIFYNASRRSIGDNDDNDNGGYVD